MVRVIDDCGTLIVHLQLVSKSADYVFTTLFKMWLFSFERDPVKKLRFQLRYQSVID